MYVRISSQVVLFSPPATTSREVIGPPGGSPSRPPERARRKHGCPHRWLATSGGTCMHIYIYICLSHCRCVLLLLRPADFFVCRALASERACQSPVVVVCACFLLASDVPSSAAAAFCRRRFFAPLSLAAGARVYHALSASLNPTCSPAKHP